MLLAQFTLLQRDKKLYKVNDYYRYSLKNLLK